MPDNVTVEATNTSGEVFATDQHVASSAHYPLSKIVWGALNTFNVTDTSNPFPVQVVSGDTNVTVTNIADNDTVVTVTGYSTIVTVTDLSTTFTQTGYVAPSTTVTVTNIAANDTLVTVTNIADNDTTVTVTDGLLKTAPSTAGGLTALSVLLSSAAQDFMTSVGRLFHISVSNESSAADVWFRVFSEDAAGVTLGTTVPKINQLIPQQGGREMEFGPYGVAMSSGMSIAASDSAASSAHTAPAATAHLTAYFAPST